jgi:branched-chain amino acid transport system ATP-binding protein
LDELLELDGVSKSFGGVDAVSDFSLAVSEGEVVGLMGPNGAGKTTLFNLISGALDADKGKVAFDGSSLRGLGPHSRVALGISRTFQISRPFPQMTVGENVMAGALFGRGRSSQGEASAAVRELLGFVSLLEKRDRPAGSLTLAEQRRLELARALATAPRLLMLDEVMAGLGPAERGPMVDLIRRVGSERGLAMIISEHVVDAVTSLCRRLVVMDRGAKLAEGETGEVLRSRAVAEVYLGGAYPIGGRPPAPLESRA